MVKILHINLKPLGDEFAEFRFSWENLSDYRERTLALSDLAALNERADTDYYTNLPVPYETTGQILYNWLDGAIRSCES